MTRIGGCRSIVVLRRSMVQMAICRFQICTEEIVQPSRTRLVEPQENPFISQAYTGSRAEMQVGLSLCNCCTDCSYKIDTKESKPLRRLSGYGQERFSSPKRSQCIILREPYTPERQNEMIWINTFIIRECRLILSVVDA